MSTEIAQFLVSVNILWAARPAPIHLDWLATSNNRKGRIAPAPLLHGLPPLAIPDRDAIRRTIAFF
jgi:hypothetical protein